MAQETYTELVTEWGEVPSAMFLRAAMSNCQRHRLILRTIGCFIRGYSSVVEIADKDVSKAAVTSYSDWNAALARAFFGRDKAGELVYLDKDDVAFEQACRDVGVELDDADESLARAVGAKLCWKQSGRAFFADFDLMTKSWVARRRDAIRESFEIPPPPHAGLPLSLPEYNLESWRPAWSWWQMAAYNCNHPEGGWGSVWR